MNENIVKNNKIYSFVKKQVMFMFKRFYGEYIVYGQENIPVDVPVIYAANHTNALMDPLAVISVLPKETQIVYLARSDYFKNDKLRKVLQFFKILPAFRMHEGMENLDKNYEVFEQCVEVLNNNKALGIMPEGNQGPLHRIRPLKKGIFRIAFAAQQRFGLEKGVKIVPIGIDYGDPDKFGDYVIINIGKAIEVSEYMAEYEENQVKGIAYLKNRLTSDLKKLTIHFNTTDYYDCFENVSRSLDTSSRRKSNLLSLFTKRQRAVARLTKLEEKKPHLIENLNIIAARFHENLNKLQLKPWIFSAQNYKTSSLLVTSLTLLITLPVFVVGFILNFLPFVAPDIVLKLLKMKKPGGLGSLRFGIGLIAFPVFYVLQAIYISKKFKDSLLHFILLLPLQIIFGRLALLWFKSFKNLEVKVRYRILSHKKSGLLRETEHMYEELDGLLHA